MSNQTTRFPLQIQSCAKIFVYLPASELEHIEKQNIVLTTLEGVESKKYTPQNQNQYF